MVQHVDVTSRKHAEDALRNQTRRLETLNRLSKSIATDLDLERIVQTVTDIATELSGAVWRLLLQRDRRQGRTVPALYALGCAA